MSNRQIITDHLLVRWLERVEGLNIETMRAAAGRAGYDSNSDREVVDFITVYTPVDVSGIRRELTSVVAPAAARRASQVTYKNHAIKLRDGCGTTVCLTGKRYEPARRKWNWKWCRSEA